MEILKDYDVSIQYHLEKNNVWAYAFSRKEVSMGFLAYFECNQVTFVPGNLDLKVQVHIVGHPLNGRGLDASSVIMINDISLQSECLPIEASIVTQPRVEIMF